MVRNLLWRGMLAGILAALLATLFARAFAEPQIDLAIGYEEIHRHHDGYAMEGPPLVSRETQKGLGLFIALGLYGAAIGGILSLVFAYGYGRFAHIGPRSFALILAGLAFVLIVLVPSIKYPQTPPAVGAHETVGLRTAAYFAVIALSLAAFMIAARLRRMLAGSCRAFDAGLLAVGAYTILIALGQTALPHIDEVPADFPASLLWRFRLASIATQLVLWTSAGLIFGVLAERLLKREVGSRAGR
jgi:predicted cobalt transporter CbtA